MFDWQQADGGSAAAAAAAPSSSDQYNGFQDTTILEKKTFTPFPSLTQTGGSTIINMELIRKRLQDRYVPSGLWAIQIRQAHFLITVPLQKEVRLRSSLTLSKLYGTLVWSVPG